MYLYFLFSLHSFTNSWDTSEKIQEKKRLVKLFNPRRSGANKRKAGIAQKDCSSCERMGGWGFTILQV